MPAKIEGDANILHMAADSRKVIGGTLFVCVPSLSGDTHAYLEEAAAGEAVGAIVHSPEGFQRARELGLAAALIEPSDWEAAIWRVARAVFDDPSQRMRLVGITGTNGKTTTAWLVRDLLNALGETAGYIGTLGFQIPGEEREVPNTTPFPVDLYSMLDEAAEAGCGSMALEISSHALAQHRADGLSLAVGAFTNFSQDHLDFHHSMGLYAAAKMRLFSDFEVEHRVFNVGDPVGMEWWQKFGGLGFAIGLDEALEPGILWGVPERIGLTGITMAFIDGENSVYDVQVPLGGAYNVENALAAFACVRQMGYSPSAIAAAFPKVRPVPGRFEPVPNDAGIGVIVDYAHTPDALDKLLATARPLVEGRIFTVFGCGGDRDRAKRPLMAAAAARGSDVIVATSDNPRTEDPLAILAEVTSGIPDGFPHQVIADRPAAIARAIALAEPGDAVIIAGKGHENYQIIGKTKYPMDDRELARDGLRS